MLARSYVTGSAYRSTMRLQVLEQCIQVIEVRPHYFRWILQGEVSAAESEKVHTSMSDDKNSLV